MHWPRWSSQLWQGDAHCSDRQGQGAAAGSAAGYLPACCWRSRARFDCCCVAGWCAAAFAKLLLPQGPHYHIGMKGIILAGACYVRCSIAAARPCTKAGWQEGSRALLHCCERQGCRHCTARRYHAAAALQLLVRDSKSRRNAAQALSGCRHISSGRQTPLLPLHHCGGFAGVRMPCIDVCARVLGRVPPPQPCSD